MRHQFFISGLQAGNPEGQIDLQGREIAFLTAPAIHTEEDEMVLNQPVEQTSGTQHISHGSPRCATSDRADRIPNHTLHPLVVLHDRGGHRESFFDATE